MPGVSRVGTDTAGGIITGPGSSTVFVNGDKVSLIGDSVASHDPCPEPETHCSATMVEGSTNVFASGIGVVRAGDKASCDHTATGSSDTFANWG